MVQIRVLTVVAAADDRHSSNGLVSSLVDLVAVDHKSDSLDRPESLLNL